MKELKWTDIWNKPFKYDYYGYVWGADGVMTFTVDDLTEENDKWMQEFCDNMVKLSMMKSVRSIQVSILKRDVISISGKG